MKEPAIGFYRAIIPDGQTPEAAEPANRALHDPAAAVPPQFPPILVGGSLIIGPGRNDRLTAATNQQSPGDIAIISTACIELVRPLARPPQLVRVGHGDCVERRGEEPGLGRECRVQVCSHQSIRATDPNHPLCALPWLDRPGFGTSFSLTRCSKQGSTCSSAVYGRCSIESVRTVTGPARLRWLPTDTAVVNRCSDCHIAWAAHSTAPWSSEYSEFLGNTVGRRWVGGMPSVGVSPGAATGESSPTAHRSGGGMPFGLISLKTVIARILPRFTGFEVTPRTSPGARTLLRNLRHASVVRIPVSCQIARKPDRDVAFRVVGDKMKAARSEDQGLRQATQASLTDLFADAVSLPVRQEQRLRAIGIGQGGVGAGTETGLGLRGAPAETASAQK